MRNIEVGLSIAILNILIQCSGLINDFFLVIYYIYLKFIMAKLFVQLYSLT